MLPRTHGSAGRDRVGFGMPTPTSSGRDASSPSTPEELRDLLGLERHPTCGYVRISYTDTTSVEDGALPAPFEDARPMGSALYFMVTPDAPVALHCIENDQLYHRYLGAPLDVLLLLPDGSHRVEVMGADIASGQLLQLFIPGHTFHTARVRGEGWFLGASTEWPGVEPKDVTTGDPTELAARFPDAAALIEQFAHA